MEPDKQDLSSTTEESEIHIHEKARHRGLYVAVGVVLVLIIALVAVLFAYWPSEAEPAPDYVSGPDRPGPYQAFSSFADVDPEFAALAQAETVYEPVGAENMDIAFYNNNETSFTEEMSTLRELQSERTPEWTEALEEAQYSFDELPFGAGASVEDVLDTASTTLTYELLNTVVSQVDAFIINLQSEYDRARPHQADSSFTPAFEPAAVSSFPSLLAARAYTVAAVMSEIDPEGAEYLVALANDVAYQTHVAGIHYPSDSDAAKEVVDYYMMEFLVNTPTFMEAVAAAQAEVQALNVATTAEEMDETLE